MAEGDLQRTLGRNLAKHRKKRGLSQEAFADVLGFHRTYVGGLERGERNLSLRAVERTAAAVDRAGTVIATGDRDGMVLLWDASTLAVIARIQVGTVSELSFAPDAPELHVLHQLDDESGGLGKSTSGGSISVFDLGGRLLHVVPGVYQTAEPLAGGRWAALTTDKDLLVLDRRTCAVERLPSPCNPYGCLGVSSSRDGRWLAYVDTSDMDRSTTVVRDAKRDAAPILSVPRTDDFFVRAANDATITVKKGFSDGFHAST